MGNNSLTKDEREQAHRKMLEDRQVRGSTRSWIGPVIAPPLPPWAAEGVEIPRTNVGPNVTQARIDAYKREIRREWGREIEI